MAATSPKQSTISGANSSTTLKSLATSSATPEPSTILDLAIIGGGPAALSAALYSARAGIKTKVFERASVGGALAEISDLSNYPGFTGPGPDLAEQMRSQAIQAGAEITYGECQKLWHTANHFELTIDGELMLAKKVIVATGSTPKKLSFTPRPPVSYCALCDGDLVKGKNIAVIGGANSAVQESLYLANLAKGLVIITHSRLKADAYLLFRLSEAQKTKSIKILEDTEATPDLLNTFDHIFVFIGKRPATDFLQSLAGSLLSKTPLLDPAGYIITVSPNQFNSTLNSSVVSNQLHSSLKSSAVPFKSPNVSLHSTIVPGLYAAGDVRSGSVKQVVTAAADGAAAAIEIATSLHLSNLE